MSQLGTRVKAQKTQNASLNWIIYLLSSERAGCLLPRRGIMKYTRVPHDIARLHSSRGGRLAGCALAALTLLAASNARATTNTFWQTSVASPTIVATNRAYATGRINPGSVPSSSAVITKVAWEENYGYGKTDSGELDSEVCTYLPPVSCSQAYYAPYATTYTFVINDFNGGAPLRAFQVLYQLTWYATEGNQSQPTVNLNSSPTIFQVNFSY